MEWWGLQYPLEMLDPQKCCQSLSGGSHRKELVCEQPGDGCIGWCKFFAYRSSVGSKWGYCQGCMLTMTRKQCLAHYSCQTQFSIEEHKLVSSMEGDSDEPNYWSCLYLPLDYGHIDWWIQRQHLKCLSGNCDNQRVKPSSGHEIS